MERLVVITGLSGSGKSLAAKGLEDLGFFCVDNLPVSLIPAFYRLIQSSGERLARAAMVVDAREREFLGQFPGILDNLRKQKVPVEVLFFECGDDVLKRRYSETRRPHPLAGTDKTLDEALAYEREALAPLREVADRIIDTSRFTSHELRSFLQGAYSAKEAGDGMSVNLMSFGFKYGVPAELDLMFDVRFLPNPYFDDELRPLDGRSKEIQAFLDDVPETMPFLEHLTSLLDFLIPLYSAEGKSYLTIGIGCTGGKHRSVGLTLRVAEHLSKTEWRSNVHHRDLGKE